MKNFSCTILSLLIAAITFGCESKDSNTTGTAGPGEVGQAGSLARFAIANEHLFAVNDGHLRIFNMSDVTNPVQISAIDLNVNVETIFPRDDSTLFIGTTNGMMIYDISQAPEVKLLSNYAHVVSCDPVVAGSAYAFVTLRSNPESNFCNRNVNQLEVIDIRELEDPKLVKTVPLIHPIGLGLYGDTLLICDKGIKVFNVANPQSPKYITADENIDAVDIIPYNDLMIVRSETGLSQYRYKKTKLTLLSEL